MSTDGAPAWRWADGIACQLVSEEVAGFPALDVRDAAVIEKKFKVTAPGLFDWSNRVGSSFAVTWTGGAAADQVTTMATSR